MKDLLLLILQIVVVACILGTFGTLMNYLFGWSIGFKGAVLPADLKAAAMFVVLGGAAASIAYLVGRKDRAQTRPE